MSTERLPLFPLTTVLFPDGPLPLRVFETRYLDMIADCLKRTAVFGVVLTTADADGGAARLAAIGCSARITDWDQGTDGLLYVTTRGERRFRLHSVSRQDDGLSIGEVTWMAPEPASKPTPEQQALVSGLQALLARNEGLYGTLETHFDDASWVGFRLAELLPLSLASRQRCLALRDPAARLELLTPVLNKLRSAQAL